MSDKPIPRLKEMHLTTPLARGGRPEAQIVIPEQEEGYLEAAKAIQRRVREASGAELVIKRGSTEGPQAWHTIALGHLGNNPVIRGLYRRWYTLVDRTHPGRGGWVVQSVHNPWGIGKNVIVLGGSDAAGASKAAERLLERLGGSDGDLSIGQTFRVEMGEDRRRESGILNGWAGEPPQEEWGFGLEGEGIAHAGLYYLATGDDRLAARFREGMLAMEQEAPELIPERQVHLTFYQKAILWDTLEESPEFSDEDRLRITRYILRVLRSAEGYENKGFRHHLQVKAPRQNHQTLLGMALFFGGVYFDKYYHLAEAQDWLRDVATLFRDYDAHSKPVCDCNFHGWACTLENVATYALAGGQSRFFESGMAREAADRGIICCDNRGTMPVLGDFQTAYGYPTSLFQKAAHYYRDGRYAFMVKRRMEALGDCGKPFRLGRHMSDDLGRLFDDVDPVEPTDMTGIRVARLDDLYYRMPETYPEGARAMFVQQANVPLDRAFDKMSFRTGFDPDDQYMLVDGVGGGSHSFEDMNSIVECSQFGKTFLVTEDSLHWPNFRDHNVVTVVRDGYGATPPTFAGMDFVADLAGFGFTRTFLKDYNGADWTRNIIWEKGSSFTVLDEVETREPGEYVLECRWKMVGDPALREHSFTVTQGGHTFTIANGDGAGLWTEAVNIGSWSDWDPEEHTRRRARYGQEDLTAHVLHESVVQEMKEGDRYTFLNTLTASKGIHPVTVAEVQPGVGRVSGPGGPALVGVGGNGPFRHKESRLVVDACLFHLRGNQLAVARGRELSLRRTLFQSDHPLDLEFDFAAGRGVVVSEGPAEVRLLFGNAGELRLNGVAADVARTHRREGKATLTFRIPAGRHDIQGTPIPLDDGLLGKVREAISCGVPARLRTTRPREAPQVRHREVWSCRPGGRISTFSVGPCGEDRPGVAVGTEDGAVALLGDGGEVRWSRKIPGPITSVVAADVDGDGMVEVVAGSDDCGIYLIGPEGTVRWRHEPEFGEQFWPWWTLGASRVKRVLVDDVDGDGIPEVIAGVGNMHLHVLDPAGREKWRFRTDHGVFVTMTSADVDGDGKREIVGGMAIKSSSSACLAIGGDGRVRKRYVNQGWTSQLTAVHVGDVDGDGEVEVVCGTNRGTNLRVFSALEGECRWGHNLGDVVTGVRSGIFNGERCVVAGSRSFSIGAFGKDGEEAWVCNVGRPVNAIEVCDVNEDGCDEVVAGCEDGGVVVVGGGGEVLGWIPDSGRVTGLWCGRLRARERLTLLVRTSDGALRAYQM